MNGDARTWDSAGRSRPCAKASLVLRVRPIHHRHSLILLTTRTHTHTHTHTLPPRALSPAPEPSPAYPLQHRASSSPAALMAAPTLPPMETDSFNPDFNNVSGAANGTAHADGAAASPVDAAASAPAVQLPDQKHDAPDAPDAQTQHKVHDVLHSDIGVNTLLNRLKASIASARVCPSRPCPPDGRLT